MLEGDKWLLRRIPKGKFLGEVVGRYLRKGEGHEQWHRV